jgi:putative membrane protein
MMVSNRASFLRVLVWQWKHSLVFLACGLVAAVAHEVFDLLPKSFPPSPAAIIGAAVGIFASFRANAAYQRWWEGRGLWGRLVNSSRLLSTQATAYLSPARAHRVVLRHALYVHILRCQLRDDDPFADEHVKRLLGLLAVDDDTVARYRTQTSLCHALVDEGLKDCAAEPDLVPQRLQSLDATFAAFLDVQGGCERIKRTPMPRGYAFFVERLIFMFAAFFPLSVVADLSWFVIPLNLLVAMGFTLISETGRVLEDPFTWFYNSLPISQIAVNIERNTRQRVGDVDVPAAVVVDKEGILY